MGTRKKKLKVTLTDDNPIIRAGIQALLEKVVHVELVDQDEAAIAPQPANLAHHLTPRQQAVLILIADGKNTKAISNALKISVKTVEAHRAKLMGKLGIDSIAGLTRYAIKIGLVSLDE